MAGVEPTVEVDETETEEVEDHDEIQGVSDESE